jgi:curved DNA-binding protein CbpA
MLLMLKSSGPLRVVGFGMAGKVKSLVSRKRSEAGPKDYYEVLRVHPRADASLIEEAYWHLARQYQAEIGTRPEAAKRLDELNDAYNVLRTPALRQSYDELTRARRAAEGVESRPGPAPAPTKSDKPKRAAKEERKPEKERSPDVIRWEMPPLQAAVTAVGLIVLGSIALRYGAPVFLTLILAGVAIFCALFPWRFGRMSRVARLAYERRQRQLPADASALRESTAAMVARWRQEQGLQPRPPSRPGSPEQANPREGAERPGGGP